MAGDCLQLENISLDPGREKRGKKLDKIIDKYYDDPMIQALTNSTPGDFKRLYKDVFDGALDFDVSRLPTNTELKKLDRTVTQYLAEMKKIPTPLGAAFKLPRVLMAKFPVTHKLEKALTRADAFNRGHTRDVGHSLNEITRLIDVASGQNGWMSKFRRGRSEAQKALKDLYTEHNHIKETKGDTAAEKYYQENLANLESNGEVSALQSLHELMLDPKTVRKQDALSEGSMKYPPSLVKAMKIWHFGSKDPKTNKQLHLPLKEELWRILGEGLKDNIDILESRLTRYNEGTYRIERLQKLYDDYFAPKAPKKVENYFPRQLIDIAPTFTKLSEDVWSRKVDTNPEVVSKYIDRMVDDVTNNLTQPASVFERGEHASTRLSKDVIGVLDTYAKNAMRFNHNARISKITIEGLRDIQTLDGTAFDKHANFWVDYIKDTHETALGLKMNNSKLAQIARVATSWQFFSKLGLNIRSAAKNASQSMQHWVWWGTKSISQSMKDLRDPNLKAIINNEMKLNGYEFVNIQEFAQPNKLLNSLEIRPDGKVIQNTPSMVAKFTDTLESVARTSGKAMEWVENHVNRGYGFKFAFLEKYRSLTEGEAGKVLLKKELLKSPSRYEKLHKGKDYDWKELDISEKITKEAIRKSSAYAGDMVDLIHYNYSPWGKPKILRGAGGAVVGQFSTYSINFFNYQYQIARKAGNEILAGQIFTPETWRMYRLGTMYAFVSAFSALTNSAWSNLVENDTWDRLKQFDMWLGGTPEEKEKAFYGKNPITAHLGPTIGDIITFGSMMNLNSMTDSDVESYSDLYRQATEELDRKWSPTEEVFRTLNVGGTRSVRNAGQMVNGSSFSTFVQQELGLYKPHDKGTKALKDLLLSPLQKIPIPSVADYFTPDEKPDRRRGRKRTKSPHTDGEVQLILKSLQSI